MRSTWTGCASTQRFRLTVDRDHAVLRVPVAAAVYVDRGEVTELAWQRGLVTGQVVLLTGNGRLAHVWFTTLRNRHTRHALTRLGWWQRRLGRATTGHGSLPAPDRRPVHRTCDG